MEIRGPFLASKTILQLVPRMELGGVERGTVEIAAAIVHAGGRALVASEGGRLESALSEVGAVHLSLPLSRKTPLALWQNRRRLQELLQKERVDLVHARSRAPAWSALGACRTVGCPLVTTYHGTYTEGFPGKRFYNSVMARGTRVIAVSHFIAKHVAARYPFAKSRLRVIHRGVDPAYFDPQTLSPESCAQHSVTWGIPSRFSEALPRGHPLIFLLPGRLSSWKGQEDFIEAFRILKSDPTLPPIIGLIVGAAGEGDQLILARLHRQIAQANLEEELRFLGPLSDMRNAYALADGVVSASRHPEAFGRVMAEAQAMGKPVIATAHGGALEIVEKERTGFLVPPRDPSALAQALAQFCRMSLEERQRMGLRARLRCIDLFSLIAFQEATCALYREIFEEGLT